MFELTSALIEALSGDGCEADVSELARKNDDNMASSIAGIMAFASVDGIGDDALFTCTSLYSALLICCPLAIYYKPDDAVRGALVSRWGTRKRREPRP